MGASTLHTIGITMNKLLVLALLAAALNLAYGHLDMLCSSTDPAKAGEIDFYFGTYHNYQSNTPPGTVTISQPGVAGGAKLSGTFANKYKAGKSGKYMIDDVPSVKANLLEAGALKSDKAMVDCYVVNAASAAKKPPSKGQWIVPQPHNLKKGDLLCQPSGAWTYVKMWSKLSIKGAKSGDWMLEVHGTDQVYDPGQKACSLSKSNPKWIGGMTVADGTPPCPGTPPVGSDIDAASVASCANLIGGAMCSGFKCAAKLGKNAKLSGHIKCNKGKWDVTAKCVGESKCAMEAMTAISTVKSTVAQCQSVIDGMSNGAHCPNEMSKVVADAKTAASTAATNAGNTATQLASASKTPVQFNAIPLNTIDPKNCAGLFSKLKANSNYNAAKSALDTAKTAKTNADAAKVAADKAVTDAIAAQKKAILKCKCNAKEKALEAYEKCTQNSKAQKAQWRKSYHLQCVEQGDVSIGTNHKASGTCTIPAVPTNTKKKMAFNVSEKECMAAKKMLFEDEQMDEQFEASIADEEDEALVEIEDQQAPKMPGWHQMEDGTMMRDSDM